MVGFLGFNGFLGPATARMRVKWAGWWLASLLLCSFASAEGAVGG